MSNHLQKMQLEHKLNSAVADLQQRRARSEEIDSYETSSGRCTECGSGVAIVIHVMKDKLTGETWNDRRREGCDC